MVLEQELKELRSFIEIGRQHKAVVSKTDTYWQIHHSLLVIKAIMENIQKSDPKKYQWKFNLTRIYIMFRGSIPRGVGRSPKQLIPPSEFSKEELSQLLKETENLLSKFDDLKPNQYFKHPLFGKMNKKAAKKFLGIHTNHHLKIIKDILK